MSEARLRCLEIAAQQIGPWTKGRIGKHQVTLLSLAEMYRVFCDEGYTAAREIAENNVREKTADVVTLIVRKENN